ncbi:hypothetical protein WICMUC_002695 [Wickerhamomyces mucosus]|uniref:Uncharacterized protein n=1 Tax=Wickerhamomyces mucosus TaxID=1378264 RepID=A0A9P8PQ54_9ASCO|nr:hypothetical protein WICMUC_002695 [Wickerhamomyces mucosus]
MTSVTPDSLSESFIIHDGVISSQAPGNFQPVPIDINSKNRGADGFQPQISTAEQIPLNESINVELIDEKKNENLKVEEQNARQDDSNESESKIKKALYLRDKLDALLRRTIHSKQNCERLAHDNAYLQEFVGNLMSTGDYLSRKL